MEYYYGTTMTPLAKGKGYRNPSAFLGRIPDNALHVYVVGNWPRVVAACVAQGIDYTMIDPNNHKILGTVFAPGLDYPQTVIPDVIPQTAYLPTAERRSVQASVEIPAGWQQMLWVDLRRLAASVSDLPIINKTQAFDAIQRELTLRDGYVG